MSDLLADLRMKPRFIPRKQSSFSRGLKALNLEGDSGFVRYNIPGITRLHDLNPKILVCSLKLVENQVDPDPAVIKRRPEFLGLVESLGLLKRRSSRSSRASKEVENYGVNLILLEVFVYIYIIRKAKAEEQAGKTIQEEQLELV